MNFFSLVISLILCVLLCFNVSSAFMKDFIEKGYSALIYGGCNFFDCCHESWQYANVTHLDNTLNERVYGQHIATHIVTSALKSHVKGKNDKPLVLSFHGLPGVGKNYVTNFIKENLFKYGEKDTHIHMFSGRLHFRLESQVELYQEQLASWVKGNVSICASSLFVFDEVDKIPPGVFNSIKPYLDYHSNIDGVDFRNSIFIFISDTGSKAILDKMVTYYSNGKTREELNLGDFEELIRIGAFTESGGLRESDVIARSLVDHYIPFLPLEEQHVKLCIKDAFLRKGAHYISDNDVLKVLEGVTYGPKSMPIFSKTGCKRLSQKVSVVLEGRRSDL